MSTIKEYTIVTGLNPAALSTTVNSKIKSGWQPFGSVQVAIVTKPISISTAQAKQEIHCFQAMIKIN